MGQDSVNTESAIIPFSKDLHPMTSTQCKANTTLSKILKGMEDVNHSSNNQTIAEWRNRPKERQCILAKKIGDLIAIACGRMTRPQEIWFDVGGEEDHNHQVVPYKSRSSKDRKPKVEKYEKRSRKAAKTLIGMFRKRVSFSLRKWKAIESKGSSLDANEAETKTRCETEGLELCKKRILMGEKCRPLNVSGVLHYDKHGILLPEDVFST